MAPSAAGIAQLAQGLTRVARPLSAAPVRSSAAIAQSTVTRSVNLANQSVEAGLTRVARPFPFTAASRANGLARSASLASEAAGSRQSQAILDQSRRALEGQFRRQAVRDTARAAIAPATRAASTAGGLLSKVPLVGTVIQRAAPFVKGAGPFLALSALSAIPSIFEYFAPGVHNWLLGGWRGDGTQKGELSYPSRTPGYRAVRYFVKRRYPAFDNCTITGEVNSTTLTAQYQGPISFYSIKVGDGYMTCAGRVVDIMQYRMKYGPTQTDVVLFSARPSLSGWYLELYAIPEDGVDETQPDLKNPIVKPALITQNPTKTAPSQTPGMSPADIAKLAAITAVAATIAAGKYSTQPPSARDALKTPQKRYGTQVAPSPTQTAPASQPCKGNACGQAGLDATKQNGEDLQKILDLLNLLGIEDLKKTVKRIDEKAGDQILDGRGNKIGIGGAVLKVFERVNKVGDYLRFDRITNVLTLAATVHNAAMLSRNLGETLASALSSALAAIGIKDADGDQLDINSIVGKSVEGAIKGAIGAENYTELSTNWKKASRIYQASANLLNNVQSLRYSITGALETIASMNGKVANALKKYGVLGDNAYPWMNPSPNFDNKFMRGLETAENAISNIDSIASEVLSAQETVTEIGKQKTELATAIKDGTEKPGVDNTQQKEKATAATAASKSPDINPVDLVKPGGV
jgi:hypothetical protein